MASTAHRAEKPDRPLRPSPILLQKLAKIVSEADRPTFTSPPLDAEVRAWLEAMRDIGMVKP